VRHDERVRTYRDEAVVLRTHKLGEADRIVTLLTRHHGRVRAVGKGVRRTSSRFGARLEPYMLLDVQLHVGRSLDVVTQVETLAPYGRFLAEDYGRWTAAAAVAETAERLTPEEREPATQQFLLVVGAMRTLAAGQHDPSLVLDAYLLRAMAVAGWGASLAACAQCGDPAAAAASQPAFAVAAGGVVCAVCRPPGAAAPDARTLALLQQLLSGDWDRADASEARQRREGSGLVAAYLQWHLERAVRSLPLVERA